MKGILLAALSAAVLTAQAPPPPTPPPADGPKQVFGGRLLDSTTGQPVRGARITLAQQRNQLASADSDFEGRFRIEEAPVGEWSLSVTKSGYAAYFRRVSVPAAQPRTGLELTLDRMSVITGRVLDHRDRPLVGAKVVAFTPQPEDGADLYYQGVGRQQFESRTDDRGEYRIWSLAPGAYYLAVVPESRQPAPGLIRFEASAGFYPSASSLEEAEMVQLGWGQVREGVDFRLDQPADTSAEIQATPPAGEQSCESCRIQTFLDYSSSWIEVGGAPLSGRTDARIEGLPPGPYTVHFGGGSGPVGTGFHGFAKLTLSERRPASVTVAAWGEAPVRGRIVLEDRPAGPQAENPQPWRGGLRVMPSLRTLQLGMMTRQMFANVEISGTEAPFELGCFPGEITLQLMGGDGAYVAGVSLDGRPLDSPAITIPPEGIPDGLAVRVRFDKGTLEGVIEIPEREEDLPPDYIVYARPAGPGSAFLHTRPTRADRAGSFRMELPPGTYDAVAVVSGPNVRDLADLSRQDVLRKFARRVEIKAGETARVTLPVVPGR